MCYYNTEPFYYMSKAKSRRKRRVAVSIIMGFLFVVALAIVVPFGILGIRTSRLNKDYAYLKTDATYSQKVEVTGINLVKQHVSCGYASIEMMSEYYGKKVTEDDLDTKNKGAVSTASTGGFLKEINASIEGKDFVKKTYLTNDDYLKEIHTSLSKNNPVAIEWAAKFEEEWTLHFSVVTAMDLSKDQITIYNPYGYIEDINSDEFISRTTFKAYKNLPLFLNFGFAFGAFDKNALFYAK